MTNSMAMLPNDKHPGPGCACRDCLRTYPEAQSSKQKSPRALIEELHGYVTGVMDRKGYSAVLQEIEARLTVETFDNRSKAVPREVAIADLPAHARAAIETTTEPYLHDRANGVHGIYCIARQRDGVTEYWTGKKWAAFCNDLYFDLRHAEKASDEYQPQCSHGYFRGQCHSADCAYFPAKTSGDSHG